MSDVLMGKKIGQGGVISEREVMDALRAGQLVAVLEWIESARVDRATAQRVIDQFRNEQGSVWLQLRRSAFG
jgi:hypothetical protein